MKNLTPVGLAALLIATVAGCGITLQSFLPTMPETPEPEAAASPAAAASMAAAPAAAPSVPAQPNGLSALMPSPEATAALSPAAAASPPVSATQKARQAPAAAATQVASGPKTPGSEWIGKSRKDVVEKLGMPLSAIPADDTGGEILFYTHYVFESGPGGLITKATVIK